MSAQQIVVVAQGLLDNQTKKEIVVMARQYGWRGDDARAPALQLALFVAGKIAAQGDKESGIKDGAAMGQGDGKGPQGEGSKMGGEGGDAEGAAQGAAEGQGEAQGEQPAEGEGSGDQGQGGQGEGSGDDAEGEGDDAEGDQGEGEGEGDDAEGDDAEGDQGEGDQGDKAEDKPAMPPAKPALPDMAAAFEEAAKGPQKAEGDEAEGEGPQGQGDEAQGGEGEGPQANGDDLDAEWRDLLKKSGIKTPHRMLRKVWLVAAKAKQNVLLVGPAGSGKTTIAMQLSQLLGVPFSSLSCSQGMTESNLSGMLLPIKAGGTFDYVPSPMVKCLSQPSVYLLDDMDRGDANVMVMLHQLLANGSITIPQKLVDPTVYKHTDCIFIAGANRVGSLGSGIYSEAGDLDGATIDRFYLIEIGYDVNYIKAKFKSGKAAPKSAAWRPVAPATAEQIEQAGEWFMKVFANVERAKIDRIFATRAADKIIAAMRVGVPFAEAKADIVADWSKDELQRAGV